MKTTKMIQPNQSWWNPWENTTLCNDFASSTSSFWHQRDSACLVVAWWNCWKVRIRAKLSACLRTWSWNLLAYMMFHLICFKVLGPARSFGWFLMNRIIGSSHLCSLRFHHVRRKNIADGFSDSCLHHLSVAVPRCTKRLGVSIASPQGPSCPTGIPPRWAAPGRDRRNEPVRPVTHGAWRRAVTHGDAFMFKSQQKQVATQHSNTPRLQQTAKQRKQNRENRENRETKLSNNLWNIHWNIHVKSLHEISDFSMIFHGFPGVFPGFSAFFHQFRSPKLSLPPPPFRSEPSRLAGLAGQHLGGAVRHVHGAGEPETFPRSSSDPLDDD